MEMIMKTFMKMIHHDPIEKDTPPLTFLKIEKKTTEKDFELERHSPSIDILWLKFKHIQKWNTQIQTIFPNFQLCITNDQCMYPKLYRSFVSFYLDNHPRTLVDNSKQK